MRKSITFPIWQINYHSVVDYYKLTSSDQLPFTVEEYDSEDPTYNEDTLVLDDSGRRIRLLMNSKHEIEILELESENQHQHDLVLLERVKKADQIVFPIWQVVLKVQGQDKSGSKETLGCLQGLLSFGVANDQDRRLDSFFKLSKANKFYDSKSKPNAEERIFIDNLGRRLDILIESSQIFRAELESEAPEQKDLEILRRVKKNLGYTDN